MSEELKLRMAGYVLNLGQAVRNLDGQLALEKRIRLAAKASAEQKVSDLKSVVLDQRHRASAERLKRMLDDFGGENVQISENDGGATQMVDNPVCPCLPPFVSQAEQFGFSPQEIRRMACMTCMPSYAMGAKLVGVKFRGKLTKTKEGCWMSFSNFSSHPRL